MEASRPQGDLVMPQEGVSSLELSIGLVVIVELVVLLVTTWRRGGSWWLAVTWAVLGSLYLIAAGGARRRGTLAQRRSLLLVGCTGLTYASLIFAGPLVSVGAAFIATAGLAIFVRGRRGVAMVGIATTLPFLLVGAACHLGWLNPAAGAVPLGIDVQIRTALIACILVLISGLAGARVKEHIDSAYGAAVASLALSNRDEAVRHHARDATAVAARHAAMGRLAGGVAHDINNALAVVLTNARLLEEVTEDDPAGRAAARRMATASQRAAGRIRAVLGSGRMSDAGIDESSPHEVVTRLREVLDATSVVTTRVHASPSVEERLVGVGPTSLYSVLLTLCLDGLGVLERADTLDIDLAPIGEGPQRRGVRVQLTGHGPGVEAALARNGEAPSVAAATATVARRGGEVRLEPGEARVTVLLPGADRGMSLAPPAPPPSSDRRRVLVVDDEAGVRRAIGRLLRRHGYEVDVADGGASATELFEASSYGLLVSDATMPGTDTPALLEAFSAAQPQVPILICSAHVEAAPIAQGIASGAYLFLAKPFQPRELLALVDQALPREVQP